MVVLFIADATHSHQNLEFEQKFIQISRQQSRDFLVKTVHVWKSCDLLQVSVEGCLGVDLTGYFIQRSLNQIPKHDLEFWNVQKNFFKAQMEWSMTQQETHTGACSCGAVRYESHGKPTRVAVCHCRYCQTRTGSAFGMNVYFEDSQIKVRSGQVNWRNIPSRTMQIVTFTTASARTVELQSSG